MILNERKWKKGLRHFDKRLAENLQEKTCDFDIYKRDLETSVGTSEAENPGNKLGPHWRHIERLGNDGDLRLRVTIE